MPDLRPRRADELGEAVGRERASGRDEELPRPGLRDGRADLLADAGGERVGEAFVVDASHQDPRRETAHEREGRARLAVRPRDRVDRVVEQAVQVEATPVSVEDVALPEGPDRLQEREVEGAHEPLVLLRRDRLARGGNGVEDPRGSAVQARDRVADEVVVDDGQHRLEVGGMLLHEGPHRLLQDVPAQRVPRVEDRVDDERLALELQPDQPDGLELLSERPLMHVERREPLEVADLGHGLDATRHGIGVVVHDLEPVQVVGREELEMGLGGALGRRVLQSEVVPDAERRPVDLGPGQRGPNPLDLRHRHGGAPCGLRSRRARGGR